MVKTVQIKFVKIKYSGGSIGDDIRVEIEMLNQILSVDKRMKAGATVEINRDVAIFETNQKIFKADLRITVIEKDLLFNDVGSIDSDIKIDTSITKPQQFVYEVQIRETRSILGKIWGDRIAVFEIILEAKVGDMIKYVPNEGDGWINIKLDNKKVESLPAYLKVRIDNRDNEREYFLILEGPYRGKSASVKLRNDKTSQFVFGIQHGLPVYATYSISKKVFTLNNRKYKADDDPYNPWEKGLYDIEIPDSPHEKGKRYLDRSRLAKVWFRIGHDGARYLHTGRISAGCMTILEVEKWDEICEILLKARKDSISVGVVEVID